MLTPFTGKSILITGGTGTLGTHLVNMIRTRSPKKIIVFSRDEYKQVQFKRELAEGKNPKVRWMLGSVRNYDRLCRAMTGVDMVIHTAAMKHVDLSEYNPFECIDTNINGTRNVIDAAIDCGVRKVLFISSDKAVNPVNIYGASKKVAEHMVIASSVYAGKKGTMFSAIRFGNFIGSRGSVLELWDQLSAQGKPLPITDKNMMRFWIWPISAAVDCLAAISDMKGGEIFIPIMGEKSLLQFAYERYGDSVEIVETGLRVGEKMEEELYTQDEWDRSELVGGMRVIQPEVKR